MKELGLGVVPQNKPLVETMEMLDHFRAYEYMEQTLNEPLTEDYIKHLHFLLTEHTLSYRHQDAVPGEYTIVDTGAGDTIFGDHNTLISKLPQLLDKTNEAIAKPMPPMFVSATFHGYFIFLYPFRDRNGRLARLLSNKILLQQNLPHLVIRVEEKEEYIKALKLFHKDSIEHLISFFYQTAINRMKNEIEQKKNSQKKWRFLF